MKSSHELRVVEEGETGTCDTMTMEGDERGNESTEEENNDRSSAGEDRLIYSIEDTPPWHLSLLFGFQVKVMII